MVPLILTDDQKHCQLHISSALLHNAQMFDRVITGLKHVVFNMTQKQNARACSGKHTSAKKSLHVQDYACVFSQSQLDSSL